MYRIIEKSISEPCGYLVVEKDIKEILNDKYLLKIYTEKDTGGVVFHGSDGIISETLLEIKEDINTLYKEYNELYVQFNSLKRDLEELSHFRKKISFTSIDDSGITSQLDEDSKQLGIIINSIITKIYNYNYLANIMGE